MAINKVILVGNVGKDPEVRYVENNVAVANFPLATSERGYTSRSGAQIPERTEWHNIVLWRGLAEVAEKQGKKGTQLYIEGKLRTRSWTDSNNVVRYTTEIFADNMEILSRRDTNNSQQVQEQPAISNPEVSESDDLPFQLLVGS